MDLFMLKDFRSELIRRLMSALIKRSKGGDYVEKLESSYKTNMTIIILLVTILITQSVKLISLNEYTKDVEFVYESLHKAAEEQKDAVITLTKINKDFALKNLELQNENKELEKDIKFLINKIENDKKDKK